MSGTQHVQTGPTDQFSEVVLENQRSIHAVAEDTTINREELRKVSPFRDTFTLKGLVFTVRTAYNICSCCAERTVTSNFFNTDSNDVDVFSKLEFSRRIPAVQI